jgi:hypothetical protein
MNSPTEQTQHAANQVLDKLDDCVRKNPLGTLLAAAGVGVATVLIARALTPTPQHRAVRLLEDIQDRLADLAEDSASVFGRGADYVSDLDIEGQLSKAGKRIKKLFH